MKIVRKRTDESEIKWETLKEIGCGDTFVIKDDWEVDGEDSSIYIKIDDQERVTDQIRILELESGTISTHHSIIKVFSFLCDLHPQLDLSTLQN